MRKFVAVGVAVFGVLSSSAALADDSSAALGAGGLVLTKSADIRMAREDLRISPNEVRVRYEFVNDSAKDIDTIVAFPLPDIDLGEYSESPIGTIKDQSPNFVGFVLTVDGKTVPTTAEERAVYNGHDVTALVKAAGLPINMAGTKLYDLLPKLSMSARKSLVKAGILDIEGPKGPDVAGTDFHPMWIAQTKFWWRQRFGAGKTVVITHSYQPVTGQSFFGESDLAAKDQSLYYGKNYCLDAATKAAIAAKLAEKKKASSDEGYLIAYSTNFVLKTANNWKGGIGQFHLTLDKLAAANVLSLCWDGDLRKTEATTFEATQTHFAPKRDIQLLVLK